MLIETAVTAQKKCCKRNFIWWDRKIALHNQLNLCWYIYFNSFVCVWIICLLSDQSSIKQSPEYTFTFDTKNAFNRFRFKYWSRCLYSSTKKVYNNETQLNRKYQYVTQATTQVKTAGRLISYNYKNDHFTISPGKQL